MKNKGALLAALALGSMSAFSPNSVAIMPSRVI